MTDTNDASTVEPSEVTMTEPIVPEPRERVRPSRLKRNGGTHYAATLAATLQPLSSRERGLVLDLLTELPQPDKGQLRDMGRSKIEAVGLTLGAVLTTIARAGNVAAVKTVVEAVRALLEAGRDLDPETVQLQHQAVAAMLQTDQVEASASSDRRTRSRSR